MKPRIHGEFQIFRGEITIEIDFHYIFILFFINFYRRSLNMSLNQGWTLVPGQCHVFKLLEPGQDCPAYDCPEGRTDRDKEKAGLSRPVPYPFLLEIKLFVTS